MILFTNGCSWTQGGGLEPFYNTDEERQKLVWPHHLGNLLQASKVINLAEGCGSNQRTIRTTFDYFLQEYSNEPMMAVIQITDPARYEYYITDRLDDASNKPENWAKITPSSIMSDIDIDEVDASSRRDKRLETYTLLEGWYKLVTDCSALAKLFEKHNIEYYFFAGATIVYQSLMPVEYVNYLKQINFIGMDKIWTNEPISDLDPHPSVLGHKQIAENIYKSIRP